MDAFYLWEAWESMINTQKFSANMFCMCFIRLAHVLQLLVLQSCMCVCVFCLLLMLYGKCTHISRNVCQFFSVQLGSLIKSFTHPNCCRNCAKEGNRKCIVITRESRAACCRNVQKEEAESAHCLPLFHVKQVILSVLYTFSPITSLWTFTFLPCTRVHYVILACHLLLSL